MSPVDLYASERSPCRDCPDMMLDKTFNEKCRDCEKRIKYMGLKMEKNFKAEAPKTRVCARENCERAGQALDIGEFYRAATAVGGRDTVCKKCRNREQTAKRRLNRKADPAVEPIKNPISSSDPLLSIFAEHRELYGQLCNAAKRDFRTPGGQVLFLISRAIKAGSPAERNEK